MKSLYKKVLTIVGVLIFIALVAVGFKFYGLENGSGFATDVVVKFYGISSNKISHAEDELSKNLWTDLLNKRNKYAIEIAKLPAENLQRLIFKRMSDWTVTLYEAPEAEAYFKSDSRFELLNERKKGLSEFKKLQKLRLEKIITKYKERTLPQNAGRYGLVMIADSLLPKNKELFLSILNEEDRLFLEEFDDFRFSLRDEINEKINGLNLDAEMAIQACNNTSKPLQRFVFSISGYEYKRSTKFAPEAGIPANFTFRSSDLIIAPGKCDVMFWSSKFKMYNRYTIDDVKSFW